jgi:hypothetical protein
MSILTGCTALVIGVIATMPKGYVSKYVVLFMYMNDEEGNDKIWKIKRNNHNF